MGSQEIAREDQISSPPISSSQNLEKPHRVDSLSPLERLRTSASAKHTRQNAFMVSRPACQLPWHFKNIPKHSSPHVTSDNGALLTGQGAWVAASYPLTNGTFILIAGRLGAIYGHKWMLTIGCTWWVIWTLACGFAPNLVALCTMRGLAGIGGAIMVPNAVALLGITFPPGRQRNLAMGLFGAMAPVGAAGGALIAGLIVQLTEWRWIFFLMAILGFVVYSGALLSVPSDIPVDPKGSIDWIGAYLGVAGLILFNFVWNQAPAVGWQEPYNYTLIVSILHLSLFAVWEAKFATSPILPFDIWKSPSFGTLIILIFCSFMSLGIYLWYYALFAFNIRHYTIIEAGANYQPLTILGTAAAFLAAWLVPRLPAQFIIAIGNGALVVSNLLLATTPRDQTWWAMMFPSVCVVAFSVDLIFASSQIIASGSVGREHQGVAGSLIGTLLAYGLSTGLGFAGTIETQTNRNGQDILRGYRAALFFAVALGAVGFIGSLLFLRIKKNTQEGWENDDVLAVEAKGEIDTPSTDSSNTSSQVMV